jgi:hypothetical protein
MAYVRFSTNGFRSDVYVYASVSGGIAVHVAANRFQSDQPRPEFPDVDPSNDVAFVNAMVAYDRAITAWCDQAGRVSIDHPDAGRDFNFATPSETADFLERLAAAGFVVPPSAIHELRLESSEA